MYLTIDSVLQEQTERILANGVSILKQNIAQKRAEGTARGDYNVDLKDEITGAAAVVVNVKTGEPLAMASWPTYNVATILEDYQELLEAENAPLFNRTLMGTYAPGSTFKPCTAIAALTMGIVNTEDKIKCEGVYTRYAAEGYAPECWIWNSTKDHLTHPEENVTTAIRDSCNYYFYSIGNYLGVDDLGKFAANFGLGEYSGIELVEAKGNMSNQANHMDYAGTEWRIGDTLQAAIGQSDSVFTPIQMAEYCATVANSGTRYSASILKSIRNYDYSEKLYDREPTVMSTVESAEYNWAAVHEGMWQVLNDYINEKNVNVWVDCQWRVAGKTGTSTANKDRWFCGYTPYYTCAVWTGYDTPEYMSFYGNPATQIWQKVMASIHADLPYKDFKISYGGSPTGIFGTREELEDQALTEEERQKKKEEEQKKQEEENKKNEDDNTGGNTGGNTGIADDIFANFRDLF